ncbi:MAG: hypothetical protein V3T82_07970 [Nitrospinaceae bacterium]
MSDDDDGKIGIAAAVDQTLIDAPALGWSGQQLSLLPSAMLGDGGKDDDANRHEATKRGKGRPPGAGNKSTMEWMKYISARYTNPLIFLAECFNRPVKDLAKELGCTSREAFGFQMAAATKLTEYTNQKMPTTVDLGVDGDLQLVIQTGWIDPNRAPMQSPDGVIIDVETIEEVE